MNQFNQERYANNLNHGIGVNKLVSPLTEKKRGKLMNFLKNRRTRRKGVKDNTYQALAKLTPNRQIAYIERKRKKETRKNRRPLLERLFRKNSKKRVDPNHVEYVERFLNRNVNPNGYNVGPGPGYGGPGPGRPVTFANRGPTNVIPVATAVHLPPSRFITGSPHPMKEKVKENGKKRIKLNSNSIRKKFFNLKHRNSISKQKSKEARSTEKRRKSLEFADFMKNKNKKPPRTWYEYWKDIQGYNEGKDDVQTRESKLFNDMNHR